MAWHLPDFADQVGRLAADTAFSGHTYLAELGDKVVRFGTDWLDRQNTRWMPVYEARPEVTVRRDHSSPAAWLRGKRILVLGAGALGAPVADMCARAGAAHLTVADHGLVHPGILARQPYTDADIGFFKARVLADRLNRIDPHATRVEALVGNVTTRLSALDLHTFDLIWDCTANRIVRAHLERTRRTDTAPWPHLATLMIGHHATRGIAAISPCGATGGGTDVLRRTALAAHADTTRAFDDLINDFFPTTPPTELFQPEPGCSDATFTGSAADVTALAGQLATGVLHALAEPADRHTMAALIVHMPTGPTSTQPPGPRWLTWPNDTVATDKATGYDVRITPIALAEMRAEARRGARVRGPRVETGGTLLGAVDDATGVIFIDEATGPPPDSLLTEAYFQHGLDGVSGHLTARRKATGNISRFLGMWHTHPHTAAQPSATDRAAMTSLTLPLDDAPRPRPRPHRRRTTPRLAPVARHRGQPRHLCPPRHPHRLGHGRAAPAATTHSPRPRAVVARRLLHPPPTIPSPSHARAPAHDPHHRPRPVRRRLRRRRLPPRLPARPARPRSPRPHPRRLRHLRRLSPRRPMGLRPERVHRLRRPYHRPAALRPTTGHRTPGIQALRGRPQPHRRRPRRHPPAVHPHHPGHCRPPSQPHRRPGRRPRPQGIRHHHPGRRHPPRSRRRADRHRPGHHQRGSLREQPQRLLPLRHHHRARPRRHRRGRLRRLPRAPA